MYQSTKILDGYSTCFRQWKANSHCNYLHGYALKFKLTFESNTLDDRNWVQDFGFASTVKRRLPYASVGVTLKEKMNDLFDHTTVVAKDDPDFDIFTLLHDKKVINLRVIDNVGCEAFAKHVFEYTELYIENSNVKLVSVECIENEKNSAIFFGK